MRYPTMTEHLLMGGGFSLLIAAAHAGVHQCDAFEVAVDVVSEVVSAALLALVVEEQVTP